MVPAPVIVSVPVAVPIPVPVSGLVAAGVLALPMQHLPGGFAGLLGQAHLNLPPHELRAIQTIQSIISVSWVLEFDEAKALGPAVAGLVPCILLP